MEEPQVPDVDELVAQLRERVAARRHAGIYPAGLEEQMSAHFRRILDLRRGSRPIPDASAAVRAAGEVLPIRAAKIPLESGVPGGEALHKAVARIVGRQTHGALQQVQAFAQPAHAALEALATAVEELTRLVTVDVAQSLDVIYERQAAQERLMSAVGLSDRGPAEAPSAERPDPRTLVARLAGSEPLLQLNGSDALEALSQLRGLDDKALGGLAASDVVGRLPLQEMIEFVALAAEKVRPGGRLLLAECAPGSSVHPAYVAFVLREAGFATAEIEWLSSPPPDNLRRLNERLFAPQDYLLVATR